MEGDDEIKALTQVSTSVFICLAYCYYVISKLPKGLARFLAILPVVSVFVYLPLLPTTLHFRFLISAFITWICSMKLLLFAFEQGPLACISCMSFPRFVFIASLPIQVKRKSPPHYIAKIGPRSFWNYSTKTLIIFLLLCVNNNYVHGRLYIPKPLVLALAFFFLCFVIEVVMALCALLAKLFFGLDLEPQFNEPLLSTSLQDLWGRRWNLTNTSLLRLAVFQPIKCLFTPIMGINWAILMGFLTTFLVSGLMHELIYFYGLRVRPTWEVTLYFVLHGVCTGVEILAKKASCGRWLLHPFVAWFLTFSFIMVTTCWLFLAQLWRAGVLERGDDEYRSLLKFIKGTIL